MKQTHELTRATCKVFEGQRSSWKRAIWNQKKRGADRRSERLKWVRLLLKHTSPRASPSHLGMPNVHCGNMFNIFAPPPSGNRGRRGVERRGGLGRSAVRPSDQNRKEWRDGLDPVPGRGRGVERVKPRSALIPAHSWRPGSLATACTISNDELECETAGEESDHMTIAMDRAGFQIQEIRKQPQS